VKLLIRKGATFPDDRKDLVEIKSEVDMENKFTQMGLPNEMSKNIFSFGAKPNISGGKRKTRKAKKSRRSKKSKRKTRKSKNKKN